jgi:integrase
VIELPKVLRPEERDRLRAHLDGSLALARQRGGWRTYRDAVFSRVLLDTGLRVAEACALVRADARVQGGERRLVVRKGKGGRKREVRLPETLRDTLRQYLDAFPAADGEAPLFPGRRQGPAIARVTGWRVFKAALRAVGLDAPRRGCHAARHGLGVALYAQTKDLRLVAAQLGHTDLRSTMIYTEPLPEDVDAALDAVSRPAAAEGPRRARGAR